MEARDIKFEDIKIGDQARFEHIFENDDLRKFAELSGDYNPLHLDAVYAAGTQFGKPIVHGALISSLISRLVGMYLPGKRALYLAQSITFRQPAYPGEHLIVAGRVTDKSEVTRLVVLAIEIKNQSGALVAEGEAKVKVL